MPIFQNYLMTLMHANETVIATNLRCQVDTVNIPLNAEVQGMIPTDWYDLYSIGWSSPIPARGDYFVDQATGTKYSVFGAPLVGVNTLQVRLTKYAGATP